MANEVQEAVRKLSNEQFYKQTAIIQPFYNGKEDTLTAQAFLDQVIDQIANNYLTEEVAYQRFPSYLKGEAKQWFQWLKASGTLPKTWIGLRNIFIKDYNVQKEANVTQLVMTSGQTVFSFHIKCYQAVEDIFKTHVRPELNYIKFVNPDDEAGNPNAAQAAVIAANDERARHLCEEYHEKGLQVLKIGMIKNFFFNGLSKPIKEHIASLPAMSFEEMLVLAKRQEQLLEDKKISAIEEQNRIAAIKDQQPRQNQNSGNKNKPKNSGNKFANQTNNKGSNAKKNVTCWFCKKSGHYQTECRTRLNQRKPIVNRQNKVFSVNGNDVYPENGCTDEELKACKENEIQGFQNEQDFQDRG